MTHGIELRLLKIIGDSLTIGSMRSVRRLADQWGPALANSPSIKTRAEYAELGKRIEAAQRIEDTHGEGSALDLDHPLVQQLIGAPEQYFSPQEIAAAQRYRATLNSQAD